MQQKTWDEVLKNKALVGCDIEFQENGVVYRGPLSGIKEDGEVICFSSPWRARLNPDTNEWENWHTTSSFINKDIVTTSEINGGPILFQIPSLGYCIIFPKKLSKLNPEKVKGLPLASERLLALYPDLPLDRQTATVLLIERCFRRQVEALEELPTDATLGDLLSKFRADSSKEEFLWFYIEAVKDEKDVHQMVY